MNKEAAPKIVKIMASKSGDLVIGLGIFLSHNKNVTSLDKNGFSFGEVYLVQPIITNIGFRHNNK